MPGLDVPGNDPGAALDARDVREHVRRLRRDRHRARAGLGISEIQFARLQFHVLPAQRQDLVQPTATAWIETPMRVSASASVRPRRRNSSSERNRSRRRSLFFTTSRHGLLARLRQLPPVLRRVPDAREDVDRLVRHRRRRPQGVMDFLLPRMVERQRRDLPERGQQVPVHGHHVHAYRVRLAPHCDMLVEPLPGEVAHRRALGVRQRRRLRQRPQWAGKPVIEIPLGKSGSVARTESENLRAGNCAEVRDPSAYGLFGPPTRRPFRVSWRWLSPWKRAICIGGVRQCVSVAAH